MATIIRMRSIKLAIIALLGFGTACSTVKEGSKSTPKDNEKVETAPSIVVMYGVRRPVDEKPKVQNAEKPAVEQKGAVTEGERSKNAE